MYKKHIAIALSLVFLIGTLVGCGNTNKSDSTSSTAASSTTASSTSAQPEEQVTLSYVSWMTKGEDKTLLNNFMKENPNIKIEDQALDGTQYDTLIKTKMLSGDVPDVFLYMATQREQFINQGYLADLTGIPGIELMDKSPQLKDLMSKDGKIYGFMVNGNAAPMWVWYNKKYFAEKGFTIPKTQEEFDNLLSKIKADGKEPLVAGGKDIWSLAYFGWMQNSLAYAKWSGSNGLEMDAKLAKGEIKYSDTKIDGLKYFEKLVKSNYFSKASLTMKWEQAAQYFVDGKAQLFLMGSWMPGSDAVKNANADNFELGLFAMPYPSAADGKIHIKAGADRILGMSASSKNSDAAKKLVEYFAKPEVLTEYLESQSLQNFLIKTKVDPIFADYNTFMDQTNIQLEFKQGTRIPSTIDSVLQASYQNILAGSSLETEVNKLDTEFDKLKQTMNVADIK